MIQKFDLSTIYAPLPTQRKFHESTAKYRLLGGAAGGGKSFAIIGETIMRCLAYDFPVTVALFRRSFPELESTIIRTMLEMLPSWFYKYNQQQHIMTTYKGDHIEFCYAESDQDVIRYQSREWDFLGIDELTHFSLYRFTYLLSRMRTTKNLKVKFFAATNPGGIGHGWVKDRWITKTCTDPGYDPAEYDFIPSKIQDNTYLMKADPDYVNRMLQLPETERRALLYGDWDLFAGMFFTEFDPTRHVVDPFPVPPTWTYVLGWDDGIAVPRAVHLYAIDPEHHVWCVWEYYRKGESIPEAARNIKDELTRLGYWELISKTVVDPSMMAKDTTSGQSSVAQLEGIGFGFKMGEIELGNNNRTEGWRLMKTYLYHEPYEEPLLKFFRTCENMIRTLPQMVYRPSRTVETDEGKKREEMDTTLEDHAVDNCRYVLMSLDSLPLRFQPGGLKLSRKLYTPHSTITNLNSRSNENI